MTRRTKWIAAVAAVVIIAAVIFAIALTSPGRSDADGPTVTIQEGTTGTPVSDKDRRDAIAIRNEAIAKAEAAIKAGTSATEDFAVSKDIPAGGDLPNAVVMGPVLDTTGAMIDDFAWNASTVNQIDHGAFLTVKATKDVCLLDWAMTALPAADGTWRVESQTVCGREAAVLIGGPGSTNFNLLGGALDDPALNKILMNAESLDYASVGASDGNAVLFIAARPAG